MKWEDITIKQYKEIERISKLKIQADFEAIDRHIMILSCLQGKDGEYYYKLPITQLEREISSNLDFFKSELKPRLNNVIEVNGEKYRVDYNIRNMNGGQYMSYMIFMADNPDNYALLMTTLCIPEGAKGWGEGYDPMELVDKFEEHMPIVDVLGVCSFFSQLLKVLTLVTLSSSTKKLKKEMKKEKDLKKRKLLEEGIKELEVQMSGIRSLNK